MYSACPIALGLTFDIVSFSIIKISPDVICPNLVEKLFAIAECTEIMDILTA